MEDRSTEAARAPHSRGERARLVHDTLQREILSLAIRPGAPLDETQLAQRFGMSRSPIREALNRLAAESLVVMLPNRSTQVAPLDLADFPRYVEALDLVQRVCTRLAAERRTEADLEEMRRCARAFDESLVPYDHLEMSAANKAFHMAIARAAANRYLSGQYGALLDEGRRLLHLNFYHLASVRLGNPLAKEHYRMIEAIEASDADAADRLAREHTRGFRDLFLEALGTVGTDNFEVEPDAGAASAVDGSDPRRVGAGRPRERPRRARPGNQAQGRE